MLVLGRSTQGAPATYLAGSAWDRGPDFTGVADWDRYLQEAASRLGSPLKIDVRAR